MWFFSSSRGGALLQKIEVTQQKAADEKRLNALYAMLTILDQKATGLLTVNAFLIATLAALLAIPDPVARLGVSLPPLVLKLQMAALGISAFLCLPVIRITWSFLDYVQVGGGGLPREFARLANVIDDRTRCYWFAWFAVLVSFLLVPAWWNWCYALVAGLVTAAWMLVQKMTS